VWAEKGESGYLVWRYYLKRDDPAPAPWTTEGKKIIKKLNLDACLESEEAKTAADKDDSKTEDEDANPTAKSQSNKRKRSKSDFAKTSKQKRQKTSSNEHAENEPIHLDDSSDDMKVEELDSYGQKIQKLIAKDLTNKGKWDEVFKKSSLKLIDRAKFIASTMKEFECGVCLSVVNEPVKGPCSCKHLTCKLCMERQLKVKPACSFCRKEFSFPDCSLQTELWNALIEIVPALKTKHGADKDKSPQPTGQTKASKNRDNKKIEKRKDKKQQTKDKKEIKDKKEVEESSEEEEEESEEASSEEEEEESEEESSEEAEGDEEEAGEKTHNRQKDSNSKKRQSTSKEMPVSKKRRVSRH